MKRFHQLLIAICVLGLGACSSSEFERNFQTPPEEVQTAVYWYWISGNISKEGVIDDLHAMKRAGINRAFIGDIGQDGLYTERNVKIFSDEWWEVMHTALKTATELGIEIGIFNSPGWSQSGGPWVKPEEAMRYLTSSQSMLKGPQSVNVKLDIPNKDFQHVRTIAYPAQQGMSQSVKSSDMKITLDKGVKSMAELKNNESNEITLSLGGTPITARSLVIYPSHRPMLTTAHLQAKVDGEFKTIADFKIDRSNANLNVGFTPYAPITVALPATTASEFKLVLDATSQAGGIDEIELSPVARLSSYAEKTLAKMCQTLRSITSEPMLRHSL